MRVFFLTKQQYMGKDLLKDHFGRFFELPRSLALGGNRVRTVCLKYWSTGHEARTTTYDFDGVEWHSFKLGWNWPGGLVRYRRRLNWLADDFAPDIVVGASDAIHVTMAASLASRFGIPLAVDLYDNFESYRATRLPGVTWGLKHGIHQATVVSTVSDELAAKVRDGYGAPGVVRTITNAICPEIFYSGDKLSARRRLGLPERAVLIGTAGALTRARGVEILYRAFERLAAKNSSAYLVVAGRNDRGSPIPKTDRIRYLGELPHSNVGDLFRALDVGVIYNRRDEFGIYCFPQKFYEMAACQLPVVAASVGAVTKMCALQENCLFDPDNPESLSLAIESQLIHAHVPSISIPTWQSRGLEFQQLLEEALRLPRRPHAFGGLHHSHIDERTNQSETVWDRTRNMDPSRADKLSRKKLC